MCICMFVHMYVCMSIDATVLRQSMLLTSKHVHAADWDSPPTSPLAGDCNVLYAHLLSNGSATSRYDSTSRLASDMKMESFIFRSGELSHSCI
jgi:hypothetical protein